MQRFVMYRRLFHDVILVLYTLYDARFFSDETLAFTCNKIREERVRLTFVHSFHALIKKGLTLLFCSRCCNNTHSQVLRRRGTPKYLFTTSRPKSLNANCKDASASHA